LRRNPRRSHLLVSTVLGKHVPTDPRMVYGAGRLLGALVGDFVSRVDTGFSNDVGTLLVGALRDLDDHAAALLKACDAHTRGARTGHHPVPIGTVVLGYAETATALGHAVADALDAPYLHSTRRLVPGVAPMAGFEEEHSHATNHLLLPEDPAILNCDGPLILVDDELSTGQTVLNTISVLHRVHPRDRYVIAALVDLRSDADCALMDATAASLGVEIDVVALAAGRVESPADVLDRGQRLVEAHEMVQPPPLRVSASVNRLGAAGWPVDVREGGRHGFYPADLSRLNSAAATVADRVVGAVTGDRVLVLGFEELMYAPLRIAVALTEHPSLAGSMVRYSTTTRSPVLAVDDPGYAIRTRLRFPAHDNPSDGPGERFAYNLGPHADGTREFTDVVLVIDEEADSTALHTDGGLLDELAGCGDHVHLVILPSYRPAPSHKEKL
jgi:hypothetical protein